MSNVELTDLIRQTVNEQRDIEDSLTNYEPTQAVSVYASVGGGNASMNGWITYDRANPTKIYFKATKFTVANGDFAGGGGLPEVIQALAPEDLEGKTGTFHASGFGLGISGGILQMWLGERPVLSLRIVLPGVGFGHWEIKGEVSFTRHD